MRTKYEKLFGKIKSTHSTAYRVGKHISLYYIGHVAEGHGAETFWVLRDSEGIEVSPHFPDLKSIFNWCNKNGYQQDNSCWRIKDINPLIRRKI